MRRQGADFEGEVKDAGFQGHEVAEAPVGRCHAFDEAFLGLRGRPPLGAEALEEVGEIGRIFAGEEVLLGGQAVNEAIAAGPVLALRGARPGGLLRVTPIGVYLCLSCHTMLPANG